MMKIASFFVALGLSRLVSASSGGSDCADTVFNFNGGTSYFAGTNSWWLSYLTSNDDLEQAVSEIASTELPVTRVWAFGNVNSPAEQSVYFQLLDTTTRQISFNQGANGIARLDTVVQMAEQYGIKLVLPLLNNWDNLGGINTYCNYFGCNETTFWKNEGAQNAYRNYIAFIVDRYQNSSAIFSWQLCNEPRCQGCEPSVITEWARDTSAYIKSIDPGRMVSLGDEGWLCGGGDGSYAYSCTTGVDFEANLAIPTLDYGTFHMYPDGWEYEYSWGNEWIEQHAALAAKYNKPIVLEEYGVQNTQENRTAIIQDWQATILANNIAYDSFWQFATNFSDGANPYDDYAIYFGTQEYSSIVSSHARAMRAKQVQKCD